MFIILRERDVFRSKVKKDGVAYFFLLCHKMASFENLISEELMILATLRNLDVYKNMFRLQLKSIFATPLTPKPFPRPVPRPKKP